MGSSDSTTGKRLDRARNRRRHSAIVTGWLAGALVLISLAVPVTPASASTIRSSSTPQVKPQPPGDLTGISCINADACTAVGWYASDDSLAEVWNGSNWAVQPTPNPADSVSTILTGVSCLSDGTCVAVGYYDTESGQALPLSEVWSGGDWSIVSPPSLTGSTSTQLFNVSCVSDTDCTAVGVYNSDLGMAEVFNGALWTVESTAHPKGAVDNQLNTVSCSGATCVAVGSYSTSSGTTKTMAESSTGTTWKILKTQNGKGDTYNSLWGLSCTSGTSCLATGFKYNGSYTSAVVLAERWNGATWQSSKPKSPKGSDSQLLSLSCGPISCTAVGSYITTANVAVSLAEEWTGAKWVIQKTPAPKGSGSYGLLGVSCGAATSCIAVGNKYVNAINTGIPMAEGWNGTKWALQTMPRS
jgi:hypothetical protein